ncbi:putative zinc finger protein [Tripterygium wilfordii]|uniref:Putative zinc finger protein n=1 Tax=Tripterygium wilfordii TaxID=458696 RepID=A0A7J7CMK5_TRIWF|nr:putative zinc finger protein [Tripterygium wilfordii]
MSTINSSSIFSSVILSVLVTLASIVPHTDARAFFVFGDSLVDNGNNNYLATTARADSPPYGIDYPTHRATGRFSNGLNIPDLISEAIGSEPTLPYLSPALTGERLLIGANFASAGIGILNDTGIQFINIIRIYKQLEYFQQYQQRCLPSHCIHTSRNFASSSMASSVVFPWSLLGLVILSLGTLGPEAVEARAFFVFGDSLVDSGNNNYLATTARADSPPYGIDYPTRRPTGRFSNGLNIPDILSEQIGSEPVLPYLNPELTGEKLLNGANFASAGIGILNDTGIQFVRPNFSSTIKNLEFLHSNSFL